ncbi:MAG: hypothetical protein DME04_26455 [Candidatus Rokuibacteriota bacterium]|nr:MAG: hypothetical protein DME04_26455 [Candidatus Rokubacteria bacterium]
MVPSTTTVRRGTLRGTGSPHEIPADRSIAWAGALSHDNYDNNVSRITENVVRRFLDPAPL